MNMFNFGGGILTGSEIDKQVRKGNINITPYDPNCINPNSYNLRLHPQLKIYKRGSDRSDVCNPNREIRECGFLENFQMDPIDMNSDNETIEINIPEEGFTLLPGVLYIGRTVERTASDKFIPMLNGRSSGGRLGISVHVCAGFGDIGFDGTWTLEITAVEPVIVYPNVEIAQVCYFKPYGKNDRLYAGRYQHQVEATSSRFFKPKHTTGRNNKKKV